MTATLHPVTLHSFLTALTDAVVSSGWQQRGAVLFVVDAEEASPPLLHLRGGETGTDFLWDLRSAAWLPLREACGCADPGGGRLLWVVYGSERDAWDLCATETAAAAGSEAERTVNADCLHRWVQRLFLLPRLPANPSGRLGSAASPQIASVERGWWWPWCSARPSSSPPPPSSSFACVSARELQGATYISGAKSGEKEEEEPGSGRSIAPCMVLRCRREWMSSRSWPRDGCPQTGWPGRPASCC